jgi:hypothetical protein
MIVIQMREINKKKQHMDMVEVESENWRVSHFLSFPALLLKFEQLK